MISLKNDYAEGAHPRIIDAITKSNMEQTDGYGLDIYSKKAIEILKDKINNINVDIHFLVGGTQTNLIAISSFLRPYEAVISPNTGHIAVMETGAIEATGHKVIATPNVNGKLTPSIIQDVLDEHTDEHMVLPKLVYISNPTEIGTIYTKDELKRIKELCDKKNLYLYIDGARLASALTSIDNDLTMSEISKLCDAFYIGATKSGALMGEALVICNENLKPNFRYNIKQKGGLLAKGRLLGIQFLELFKDDLYFELGRHSNNMSQLLKAGIKKCGYDFLVDANTNQLFPILPNSIICELEKDFKFFKWKKYDEEHSSIRLITCWATTEDMVKAFVEKLYSLK